MLPTVVSVYINTMKTTFDLNFGLYQAVKQHMDIHQNRSHGESVNLKASL